MKTIVAIASILALAGCDIPKQQGIDQCLRRELLSECLVAIHLDPAIVAHYNGWREAIADCRGSAYAMSIRHIEHIKPECAASL